MGSIAHAKVSALPDDPAAAAAGEVVPSDWNAAHNLTGIAQTDAGNTFTQPQTIDTSGVAGTALTIRAKNDSNNLVLKKEDGSILFESRYPGGVFWEWTPRAIIHLNQGFGGSAYYFSFDGNGVYGTGLQFINNASIWASLAIDASDALNRIGSSAYATAGTPLTKQNFADLNTWAWNGSNGYSLQSVIHVTAEHQTAASNDSALTFYNSYWSAIVRFFTVDKSTSFYGNVIAAGGNGTYLKLPAMTVANLAAAGTAGAGARAFVTDANATTFASVVAGGGANGVPVYSDGTNWRIG